MRVFHWNMTPPPTSRTSQRQKWRAGFACEGAAAYMGLTWRATNSLTICSELRARKSGEIEMRLVRLGRNGPGEGPLVHCHARRRAAGFSSAPAAQRRQLEGLILT